ncbi:JmjC domain, hydroxylase-domain-containing protein [Phlebopus sp. FC_14]|nr:JmjC domain, hydroxylase-domain-containing protein [Phlebopus sp. FC_14]
MSTSRTPSLTSSRSGTPALPVQPDHFFGSEGAHLPPSPNSDGRTWFDPDDDPLAHRGIPVFKPTMEEFADFEGYMNKIECWGLRSGIVKVIPPTEWVNALPSLKDQLATVKIRSPIEQHMLGRGGLFRQENVEKRRVMSVREWAELCNKEEFRAPGVEDVGLHARSTTAKARPARKSRAKPATRKSADPAEAEDHNGPVKEERAEETMDMCVDASHLVPMSPPTSVGNAQTPQFNDVDVLPTQTSDMNAPAGTEVHDIDLEEDGDGSTHRSFEDDSNPSDEKSKMKGKRAAQNRDAQLAERAAKDAAFLASFNPQKDWLPADTTNADYTNEFCQKLERQYWRNCGLGKPAWYGADMQGSLYTDETKVWNVAHLPSLLSRILPASSKGLPGVNTPYLYFGMWRATFAWHVEDMDLFSINYIHFGAPKFWYAVPQGRAAALESTMKGYFPKDTSQCPQFLRHKSFLASPTLLAQSSCRPNLLVQREREFVITYPRGYHAGFNLGFNCAESVNFALDSWLELGRKAKACQCITDSVRIDVDQLLRDREAERLNPSKRPSSKRKAEVVIDGSIRKRSKAKNGEPGPTGQKVSVTLKLGPKPADPEGFPCCLCVSMSRDGLLRVQDPPVGRRELPESLASISNFEAWMAHEECAKVVPETWVDEVETGDVLLDGSQMRELRVFGVDAIVRDRWNLKCAACTKGRQKAHGAPIQCTKGKCAKSFHVCCARDGENGIHYSIVREIEKEVVLVDLMPPVFVSAEPDTQIGVVVPHVPPPPVGTESRVLKTIKKNEVQVLCTQHNPAVAAAKKAGKQDKIRNELLALPPMSRIKIRVSAGVFEVSLVRVLEETKSVEVLWDRGIKREFKWGSVIFGNTDGQTVMQKPSELTSASERKYLVLPQSWTLSQLSMRVESRATQDTATLQVATFPPVASASSSGTSTSSTPTPTYLPTQTHQAPANAYGTGTWPYHLYQAPQVHPTYHPVSYTYPGTYPPAMPNTYHTPTDSNTAATMYRSQLQWQQPYTGPRTSGEPMGTSDQMHSVSTTPPTPAVQ